MGSDLGFGPEKVAQILKSQAQHWRKKSPESPFPLLGAYGASHTHPCPYQGSVYGSDALKLQLVSRVGYLSFWDGSWELCC